MADSFVDMLSHGTSIGCVNCQSAVQEQLFGDIVNHLQIRVAPIAGELSAQMKALFLQWTTLERGCRILCKRIILTSLVGFLFALFLFHRFWRFLFFDFGRFRCFGGLGFFLAAHHCSYADYRA